MNKPVVLVTGALTGIGRATAIAFAQEGSRVVISGRRDDAGQALVTELRALGAEAEFVRADVRREDDVRNLVDKTVARFGRLDVAVNNAGTEGQPGPLTEQSAETYAATFDTNVLGTILSLKHEMRVMLAQGHGNIVNLSSNMGSRGAAGASMRSLRARWRPACSTASRAVPTGKPAWSPVCQRNALDARRRSLRRSCFWLLTRWTSSPVKSSESMAARRPRDPRACLRLSESQRARSQ
jgi:NAD(P)-dependent dehydrogenase (short-subunit alcohol dehydrogenase family)